MFRSNAHALWFLTASLYPQATLAEEDGWKTTFLGPFSEPVWHWLANAPILPSIVLFLAVLALVWQIGGKLRRRRREARIAISGLRNGARFRVVDAMCHAVWQSRMINEVRLKRALEIARDTTDMDFTAAHLREIAKRADRLIIPTNFRWMREGVNREEKLLIFNATLSVFLADGPIGRSDRTFLRVLARGLRLGRSDLRDLARVIAG